MESEENESEEESGEERPEPRKAKYWHNQLEAAESREQKWKRRAKMVIERYLDERDGDSDAGDTRRVNILWSNTEVLKAALFSRIGDPDVRRAFPKPGPENKAARTAALVIERSLVSCSNRYDVDDEFENAVFDQVLPGRGQVWLEYEPGVDGDELRYQSAKIVHVPWDDFRHGPGKKWSDVPWVARKHLFGKDDIERGWGEEVAKRVPYNFILVEAKDRTPEQGYEDFRRAIVWEIWDRKSGNRIYVAEGYDFELQRDPDPYRLENFFPCPKPLFAIKLSDRLIPQPEYVQYQDQARELDRINTRICKLIEALKFAGVYDASSEDNEALSDLNNLTDAKFLPYKNFAALSQGGGLKAAFQTIDLVPISQAIQGLSARAISLIQSIYEVMGIADIMRGASDPNETLGAQQLKAQFGSQRLRKRQREVERFVRDAFKNKAELIAEHFTREQLQEMSGIMLPTRAEVAQAKQALQQIAQMQQQQQMAAMNGAGGPQQPAQPGLAQMPPIDPEQMKYLSEIAKSVPWEDVEVILRSDDRRNNKVDVQTDITAFEESTEEKQQRIEYLTSMTQMLERSVPAISQNPKLATLMKELTMFGSRAFKIGRTLEETLEETFTSLAESSPQPQGDPRAEQIRQKMELDKAKFQLDQAKAQLDMQAKQADIAAKGQERQLDMAAKQSELQMDREKMQMELSANQIDLVMRAQEAGLRREEINIENLSALLDYELKRRQLSLQSQPQPGQEAGFFIG